MSGFEENPFGEPTVNDPFSDPAVKRAATSTTASRGIEDYNPFADPPVHGNAQGNVQQVRGASNPPMYGGVGATQQPATLQTTVQEPPTYARNPQQTVPTTLPSTLKSPPQQETGGDWRARQEEMRNPNYYVGRNNWPPLPEQCCFQPCFYQDIDVEIHADFQNVVRQLYYLWLFYFFTLCLNVLGQLTAMFLIGAKMNVFVAIVWLLFLTPFSFMCWFRPGYKAFKNDSSISFMAFFFIFTIQLVLTTLQALGIAGKEIAGFFIAVSAFEESTGLGLIYLIITSCLTISAIGMFLLMTKIHKIYRSSGASMAKAQQEFTTNFMRNEHVQSAASEAAASAIRAQINNATQPRY